MTDAFRTHARESWKERSQRTSANHQKRVWGLPKKKKTTPEAAFGGGAVVVRPKEKNELPSGEKTKTRKPSKNARRKEKRAKSPPRERTEKCNPIWVKNWARRTVHGWSAPGKHNIVLMGEGIPGGGNKEKKK